MVKWAGGCWGLQVQKLLLASPSHRYTYLHNRRSGPHRSVQGPRAHLLKRGAKCRRCWQVDMGVCRRGAAPSSPLPEHLRPGREAQATHTPAVQVISGCFQSLRRTSPTTSSCTPVTLVRAVMLYGVSSVLVPKRAEEPRNLDC